MNLGGRLAQRPNPTYPCAGDDPEIDYPSGAIARSNRVPTWGFRGLTTP
jgi:hypothetical protein